MTSRIPTKISALSPVSKITDGVSRLSTTSKTLNSNNVTKRGPVQKNYLTPVKDSVTVITNERKQAAPISTARRSTTNKAQEILKHTVNGETTTTRKSTNKVPETSKSTVNGESTTARRSPTEAPETLKPTVKRESTTIRKSVTSATLSNLPSCKICGRHFAEDRIARHQEICEKSTKRKRKIFDPVKHRLKGTEAEGLIHKIKASSAKKQVPPVKKPDWRQKHEEFLENIREARKVKQHLAKGGKLSDLPPPKPLDTSDYTPCPHCNRKFNEAAAQRHIPKCANMRHNKPKNPAPSAHTPAAAKVSRTTKTNITRKR